MASVQPYLFEFEFESDIETQSQAEKNDRPEPPSQAGRFTVVSIYLVVVEVENVCCKEMGS